MRRGELTLKFLQLIEEVAGAASDHLLGFLTAGYGASPATLEYEAARHRRRRERAKEKWEHEKKLRQRYHRMLHYLKSQGLIEITGSGDQKKINQTTRGELKLRQLKKEMADRLVIPAYKLEPGARVLIVAFDIPEELRHKRAWLRSVLKNMNLKMIQQSVWVGKGAVPKQFLDDLEKIGLTEFVEIFEVTKSGTLQELL